MKVLKLVAMTIAVMIVLFGAVGVLAPSVFLNSASLLLNPVALYVVAGLRIFFGVLLVSVASVSRMPKTVRAVGVVLIIAGLATPFFGVERSEAVLNWWSSQDPLLVRAVAAVLVGLGAFVVYVLANGRRVAA